ncbi:MAG: hypothetical protein HY673_09585 [Chloroflexi bacterium]|nr:hypothetical protein [Chloroflexota bacterium]
MVEPKLEELIRKALVDGKLNCAAGLKIARDLKIPASKIGEATNELKIRIANCQLGCFK